MAHITIEWTRQFWVHLLVNTWPKGGPHQNRVPHTVRTGVMLPKLLGAHDMDPHGARAGPDAGVQRRVSSAASILEAMWPFPVRWFRQDVTMASLDMTCRAGRSFITCVALVSSCQPTLPCCCSLTPLSVHCRLYFLLHPFPAAPFALRTPAGPA